MGLPIGKNARADPVADVEEAANDAPIVMAGLVPAIHAVKPTSGFENAVPPQRSSGAAT